MISIAHLIKYTPKVIKDYKEIRYLIAGTTSEAIEFLFFVILISFIPHMLYLANSISFLFGVLSGFLLHKYWTFKGTQRFKIHHQLVSYLGLAGINFIMINIFIGIYVHALNVNVDLAKLMAIASTVVWTYFLSNFVIFRHREK